MGASRSMGVRALVVVIVHYQWLWRLAKISLKCLYVKFSDPNICSNNLQYIKFIAVFDKVLSNMFFTRVCINICVETDRILSWYYFKDSQNCGD